MLLLSVIIPPNYPKAQILFRMTLYIERIKLHEERWLVKILTCLYVKPSPVNINFNLAPFNNILIFTTSLELIASIKVSLLDWSHCIKHILSWVFEKKNNEDEFGSLKRQSWLLWIILHSWYTSLGLCFLLGNASVCFFLMTLKAIDLVNSSRIK